jgi:hypothetical protein
MKCLNWQSQNSQNTSKNISPYSVLNDKSLLSCWMSKTDECKRWLQTSFYTLFTYQFKQIINCSHVVERAWYRNMNMIPKHGKLSNCRFEKMSPKCRVVKMLSVPLHIVYAQYAQQTPQKEKTCSAVPSLSKTATALLRSMAEINLKHPCTIQFSLKLISCILRPYEWLSTGITSNNRTTWGLRENYLRMLDFRIAPPTVREGLSTV